MVKVRSSFDTPGIYEYCGIQRKGKTTLMVADLLNRLLNPDEGYDYEPHEVYANFHIDIDGINCYSNDRFLDQYEKIVKDKLTHKVLVIDECSQPPLFYARNYGDKRQTKLVTALWQFPKLKIPVLWSGNVGNSVDVQQRDATWVTVFPLYIERDDNWIPQRIMYRVIHNYEGIYKDYWLNNVPLVQSVFNTDMAVK